jgi:2-polyprenyl-6-hydroxyphenyl methylase/3-demethylubiquinone-9 3-methyltransferase
MAATWWDRKGPFWPLHLLNELRTAYIAEKLCRHFGRDATVDKPLAGLSIVDVGCGGGILAESMAALGANVTGIDVVEKNIRVAALHAVGEDLRIDYRVASASQLVAAGATFDVVLNMEVVEHVADVDAFMSDCSRLANDAGIMFVATINRNLLSWLFAIVGAEYVLRWLPRGTHRWRWFRTPTEIEDALSANGFSIEDVTGVSVNAVSRRFRLTGFTWVNYMIFAARP